MRLAFPLCGPLPDPSLWLDSWFNLRGRMECVVLHLLFFSGFRGRAALVVSMATRGKAARPPASLTTQQETTCLGDHWPLFLGFTQGSLQKNLGRLLLSADPEGLTGMEEILLQQEIEWAECRAWIDIPRRFHS